jgi:hypothetical protein
MKAVELVDYMIHTSYRGPSVAARDLDEFHFDDNFDNTIQLDLKGERALSPDLP